MEEEKQDRTAAQLSAWQSLVTSTKHHATRANTRLVELRSHVRAVDVGMRMYERDKEAAGTLLGSAIALRLFLFFVPFLLLLVGLAGVLGRFFSVEGISDEAGITGTLAHEMDEAFHQQSATPWLAVAIGIVGIATAGRSLTRALVLSSALAWAMGGSQRTRVRVIGVVVGIVVGTTVVTAALNRIRDGAGLAVLGVSFITVAAIYVVLWILLFLVLPRATSDPSGVIPGAAIVAVTMTGMQVVSQIYLPQRLDSASSVYGAIGVTIVTLGWFLIIGRTVAASFAVNAVLFEQVGSISSFVFGLPVIRIIPRRSERIRRFFDLPAPPVEDAPSGEAVATGGESGRR
jgi:uncharacterized BrkB/YihY/UPF0761 family membrane protein